MVQQNKQNCDVPSDENESSLDGTVYRTNKLAVVIAMEWNEHLRERENERNAKVIN